MTGEWNNITITKGGNSCLIDVTKDEEILSKMLINLKLPTSTKNRPTGAKDTIIVDLLRIEKRITIDGHLSTDTGNTASQKKASLKAIFNAGGTCTFTYDGKTVEANIEKMIITKSHFDGKEPQTDEIGYDIKISFILGTDFPNGGTS
jgi:hypothetical protein